MGTKYQQCKVLLEIARHCLRVGQLEECDKFATRSVRMAAKHGYKLLVAQSQIVKGCTANEHSEQSFRNALLVAEEIGAPELIAEASYHLGLWCRAKLNHFDAHEYLLKSSSIITNLAEHVPTSFRRSYLGSSWRQDAKRKFQDSVQNLVKEAAARQNAAMSTDGKFVRGLYAACLTDASSLNVTRVAEVVLETALATLQRSAVIVLRHNGTTSWHSRSKVPDDLQKQILGLAESTRTVPTPSTLKAFYPVTWVPFNTTHIYGGMYLSESDCDVKESEVEFLTVLGYVANAALERVQHQGQSSDYSELPVFHGIVGKSKVIKEVFRHIEIAAKSPATVLIEGESGTGKELVARAIHDCGNRAKGPFVPVDCGAIPEALIESELFGSRKGSFTGALTDRAGLFEAAHGGTIFLDEISNTSSAVQAKLLRVIQEREVRRIGETKGRPIDVRLIAATNMNLELLVQQRQFRQDLLFRLKVLHIKVPPLKSRREDIPSLVESFIERLNATHKARKHVTPAFLEELSVRTYSGNVRELQNLVERAYVFAKGAAIAVLPADSAGPDSEADPADEINSWFKDLTEGRKDFWSAIHDRYKRRDISREKVIALVDLGLRSTRGSYKTLASMFRVDESDYRRFMDFLRRNSCRLDFRPYRKLGQ